MGATAPVDYAGVEGQKQAQQSVGPVAATQSHGPAQDANPLNRLTEEQREEINEAVRTTITPTQDSDSRFRLKIQRLFRYRAMGGGSMRTISLSPLLPKANPRK